MAPTSPDSGVAPVWLRAAILASPLVFLVHDLEEYLAQPGWLAASGATIPEWVRGRIPSLEAYAWAFALLFVLHLAAALLAGRRAPPRWAVWIFVLLVMGRLTNGIPHGAQALLLQGYVPGLASAILVILPFTVLLTRGAQRQGWIRGVWMPWLLVAGFAVQAAAVAVSLAVGSRLA